MAKNEENYDKIQRYLDRELNEEELSAFEQEIESDASLADEVNLHQDMQDFLGDSPENDLRKQLEKLSANYKDTPNTQKFTSKYLLWLLPIFLLVGAFWLLNPSTSTNTNNTIKEKTTLPTEKQEQIDQVEEQSNQEVKASDKVEEKKEEDQKSTPKKEEKKSRPAKDFFDKDVNSNKKENTTQVIAANFDPNPSLEFLIENSTRGNETTLAISSKQSDANFQKSGIDFIVAGTFESEENLLDKQMKVHIFSNDPEAFDNFEPLYSEDLKLNNSAENTYSFNFNDTFQLTKGLYYYMIEDYEEEQIFFVEKFKVE